MTFIKIFASLPQYSAKAPLEHWVSRITVNTCRNQLRMEKARPEMRLADLSSEQSSLIQSLTESPDNSLLSDCVAARELVEKLLSSLRPRDRLIVTLLHLDGYSVEEIRQRTGWSTSVIRSRAFRARKQLSLLLGKLTLG